LFRVFCRKGVIVFVLKSREHTIDITTILGGVDRHPELFHMETEIQSLPHATPIGTATDGVATTNIGMFHALARETAFIPTALFRAGVVMAQRRSQSLDWWP
jgi:hypothetical protein